MDLNILNNEELSKLLDEVMAEIKSRLLNSKKIPMTYPWYPYDVWYYNTTELDCKDSTELSSL